MARTNGHRKEREQEAAFAWPGRTRSAELEQAAARAAQQGLERLRARHASLSGPVPAGPDPQPEASAAAAVAAVPAAVPEHADDPAPASDPWESDFDDLADTLIDQLRRDLGPANR